MAELMQDGRSLSAADAFVDDDSTNSAVCSDFPCLRSVISPALTSVPPSKALTRSYFTQVKHPMVPGERRKSLPSLEL
ncbi:hypothetical protein NM208_g6289 [Fusarium decemcellulare]|uniref:Uncharacterized protein n=1 Tax=Fusarium decemcellulare TaxID=57161 RepID=A0ACC1SDL6_9HYPO|nr:hypothetical protein NM208_g6289 [Fusarium decemcellulare]